MYFLKHSNFYLALACLAFLLNLLQGKSAFAADPRVEWRQLETPHFTLIFDSKQRELALAYANYAEDAWKTDSPVFGEWPAKTVLVLDDSTDLANGFATGFPYPMIYAFPVLPTELDSISDYGIWGRELLLHEYAHILTFEPSHGWVGLARDVLGSVAKPNMFLPRWYLEGLAVFMETRHSQHGRLRSLNFLSSVRALVAEDKLDPEDIARINETSIPLFPRGERPYLFGSLIWEEMVQEKGEGIVHDFNQDYGRRFPFFINAPARERLGVGYDEFLQKIYNNLNQVARAQLAQIQSAGASPVQSFENDGLNSWGAEISPDGKQLLYFRTTHNRSSQIFRVERPGGKLSQFDPGKKELLLEEAPGAEKMSWLPSSTGFVYDHVPPLSRYQQKSSLNVFDIKTKKHRAITHDVRAREPSVAPDGHRIAFVELHAGSSDLAIGDLLGNSFETLELKNIKVLVNSPFGQRISRPEFASADEIVFTQKNNAGVETPWHFILSTGKAEALSFPVSPVHFLKKTYLGLMFDSEQSGVSNVYLVEHGDHVRAVTNLKTRAYTFAFDPWGQDLFVSTLTAEGPRLERLPLKDFFAKNKSLPKISWGFESQEMPNTGNPNTSRSDSESPTTTSTPISEEGDYSPWRWLYPRYWIPVAYYLPGYFFAEATTGANDPLNHNAYNLGIAYDSLTARPAYFANYIYAGAPWVQFLLSGADYYEYIYTASFTRHQSIATALFGLVPPEGNPHFNFAAGWTYQQTELSSSVVRDGPTATASFSNVRQRGLEISPEQGVSLSWTETHFLPSRNDVEYEESDVQSSAFLSGWILPERHVIAAYLNASLAPNLGNAFLGKTTIGGNYQTPSAQTALIMRGYPSGEFFARNLLSSTLEYRFPLSYNYSGFGTSPFFVHRWHAALFVDMITLDGAYYDFNAQAYLNTKFWTAYFGTGGELRSDITIFYNIPLTLIVGLYYGVTQAATAYQLSPFIGFAL